MASCVGNTCRYFRDRLGLVEFAVGAQRDYCDPRFYLRYLQLGICCLCSAVAEFSTLTKSKDQEYREGPEATKNFERAMKSLFRAPKTASGNKKEQDTRRASSRITSTALGVRKRTISTQTPRSATTLKGLATENHLKGFFPCS